MKLIYKSVNYFKKTLNDETRRSSFINLLLKPISVILGLIYTPLLLDYLGTEKYGLWSTVLSIISWVNYFDVGIGHGLRDVLTRALATKDYDKAKRAISTAYIVLASISFLLLLISLVLIIHLDWYKVFNTDIDMRGPLAISIAFICVNFVLALANTVLYALQLSHVIAIRYCFVQLLNIMGILVLKKYTQSNLLLIATLFGATNSIIYIYNSILLLKQHSFFRISHKYFNRNGVKDIANIGIKFFIIQIACLALHTVDNLLITNMFGAVAVTPFNITYKLFNTVYAFLSAVCVPYWSKTTQAVAQNNIAWIKSNIKHLNYIGALFVAGFILLALLFKPITNIWLRKELDYPSGLVLVMCVYYCLYTIMTVKVKIINGTGMIDFQMIFMVIIGVLNIPFSIFLAKNCGLGVVGIRLATTILMLAAAIAFPLDLRRIIKILEKKSAEEKIPPQPTK